MRDLWLVMPYHGSRMSGQHLAMRFEYDTPLGLLECNTRYLRAFRGNLLVQFVLIWTEQQEKNFARYCKVIITWTVLRDVHGLFRSEFSKECDLVFPLSISSTFWFRKAIHSSCLRLLPHLLLSSIYDSIMCFGRRFLRKKWPVQNSLFYWI